MYMRNNVLHLKNKKTSRLRIWEIYGISDCRRNILLELSMWHVEKVESRCCTNSKIMNFFSTCMSKWPSHTAKHRQKYSRKFTAFSGLLAKLRAGADIYPLVHLVYDLTQKCSQSTDLRANVFRTLWGSRSTGHLLVFYI